MSKNATDKTLADYVAIAFAPALIMALVGSLVFFLLEVLYVGQYQGRLQWILFFFVFGAVLIARISMQGDIAGRAGAYGAILGLLVWIALLLYVEYPTGTRFASVGWAINLGLIAVIWWSAHRLTWDCTLIDDEVDASGAGLLEAAGLEQAPDGEHEAEPAAQETPKETSKRKKKKPTGLAAWWQRYRAYREERRRRPHTPGVWVVYFSFAALPLFGLGQMLISADTARTTAQRDACHRYTFLLMTIYVGSGLGLLLTTSFLGLRRYLRQRRVQMPAAVTSVWLTFGGLLIAALLLLGAFLPRPTAEYRKFLEWTGLAAPEREASDHAQRGDGTGRGKGRGAEGKGTDKQQDPKDSGKDGKGTEKGGKGQGKSDDKKGGGKGKGSSGKGKGDEGKGGDGKKGEEDRDQTSSGESSGPLLSEGTWTLLKWLVGIAVVLVVLFVLLRSGLRWLANFTEWARRLLAALRAFWEGLWGRGRNATTAKETEAAERPKPRPFASFRDPFTTGEAEGLSAEALVGYSFAALEAWAEERGLSRQVGETPLEFGERIGGEYPVLEGEANRLANFYASLAYAHGELPEDGRAALRQFWRVLVDAVERPMSAGVGA